jgi:periplasmic protein CpxP/Spy
MKTSSLLKIGLLIMVLINIALILLIVGKPKLPPPGAGRDFKSTIAKKLQLDEQQQEIYFKSAEKHNQEMASINQAQRPLIRNYFNLLKEENQNLEIRDSLLAEIKEVEQKKLTLTYAHFEELKEICNPDQKVLFEEIMDDIIQVLLGGQKKSPPPPRD